MVSALQSIYRNICAGVVHELHLMFALSIENLQNLFALQYKVESNASRERPSISKFEVFITKLQRRGAKVLGSWVTSLEFVVRSTLLQNAPTFKQTNKTWVDWFLERFNFPQFVKVFS